jgi:hypothetical protein
VACEDFEYLYKFKNEFVTKSKEIKQEDIIKMMPENCQLEEAIPYEDEDKPESFDELEFRGHLPLLSLHIELKAWSFIDDACNSSLDEYQTTLK